MLDEKVGDDQFPVRAGEHFLEAVHDVEFRTSKAGPIDVRAVREQGQHALRADLGEPVKVEILAVDRRLVDLEVAGVDDQADRRRDRQRHAVRHAVRHADEFDREGSNRDRFARPDRLQAIGVIDLVLIELRLEQGERERRSVDRAVEERHHVRHAADVVLVTVGQHECLDLVAAGFQVGAVGDDQIDAELVGIREHDTGIHDDRGVLPGQRHHVHAELAEAAERDDFECRGRRRCVARAYIGARGRVGYRRRIHQDPSIRCAGLPACRMGQSFRRAPQTSPGRVDNRGNPGRWERLKPGQVNKF